MATVDQPGGGRPNIQGVTGWSPEGVPVYQDDSGALYTQGPDGAYVSYTGALGGQPPPTPGGDTLPPGTGSDLGPGRQGVDPVDRVGGMSVAPPPGPGPQPGPGVNTGPATGPAPTTGPGTGSLISPFTEQFVPPAQQGLPSLNIGAPPPRGTPPAFAYPDYVPQKFIPPTIEQAVNDPGYQFTLKQGQDELTNWLASHGTFNDSSAAKALTDYGQNAASTQYQNVWGRQYQGWQGNEMTNENAYAANRANAVGNYNTNYQTQYVDPWQAQFSGWQDQIAPTTTAFTTGTAATQHANDINWQNSWNQWMQDWNIFKDQRDSTFNKQFATATA